jgi:flagella basal body P-ring formation protein FlgA
MRVFCLSFRFLAAFFLAALARADDAPGEAPFSREQLLAVLTHDISSHFNLEGDLQLDLLRAWNPPGRVAAAWSVEVLEFPSFVSSSMLLRTRVLADAQPVAETTFLVRAALWRDAWTARQPLTAGAPFDATQLEVRRVDLLREREALPAAVGDASFNFARSVPAGRLLTWRDLVRRPLVRKGDLVEVSAVDGPLVVTMKALALENGARGDRVTVRNPDSRRDFTATVTNENRVQVQF